MKVKELIYKLGQINLDADVYISCFDKGEEDIINYPLTEIEYQKNNKKSTIYVVDDKVDVVLLG